MSCVCLLLEGEFDATCGTCIQGNTDAGSLGPSITLISTFKRLVTGEIKVEEFPTINCIKINSNYFAVSGNRRLFLFKHLQEAGLLHTIKVRIVNKYNHRQFTTKCDGIYIECRGAEVKGTLQKMINERKQSEMASFLQDQQITRKISFRFVGLGSIRSVRRTQRGRVGLDLWDFVQTEEGI